MLFRSLTSLEKRRKVLASSEVMDKEGVRSIIRRHFVYIVREIKSQQISKPLPYLYVLRAHNNRKQEEKFFCRMKGSIYAVNKGRLYLILFMHSLKISLAALPQDLVKYNEEEEST